MFLKVLILLTALTAHFWLWGQWNLDRTMGFSLGLVAVSFVFLFLIIFPVQSLIKKKGFLTVYSKKWVIGLIYLYVVGVLILSAMSFSGLIKYLLPIKITLIVSYAYLKLKLKSLKKN